MCVAQSEHMQSSFLSFHLHAPSPKNGDESASPGRAAAWLHVSFGGGLLWAAAQESVKEEEECTCQQTFSPQLVNSLRASSCFTALNTGAGLAQPPQLPTNCLLHTLTTARLCSRTTALGPHMLLCGGARGLDTPTAPLIVLSHKRKVADQQEH